jgi:hypothetical protein
VPREIINDLPDASRPTATLAAPAGAVAAGVASAAVPAPPLQIPQRCPHPTTPRAQLSAARDIGLRTLYEKLKRYELG